MTLLCETKDGEYIAGVTKNPNVFRHAAETVTFIKVKPGIVKKIDAREISDGETGERKTRKLF